MTDWADEAVKEIFKSIRSGWSIEEDLTKILRAAELRGRVAGMEAAWKLVMAAENTMQAEDAIRAIIDDGANFDDVLAKLSPT